jgi:predicted component of type VI protein secretion system/pSer/pThr/pTyr-binding forkhead associated (FHA) protein/putative methionine-R-sulfoxide reductase with GAF domain
MPSEDNPSPFNWGLRSLELDSTALANDFASLRSCEVRFKDGKEISIPNDGIVGPVDIRKLLTGRGSVIVYVGIPASPSGRTSVERPRDDVRSSGRKDVLGAEREDSGSEIGMHSLESRRMQARLLLSGQDHTGLEISPLCRVERLSPRMPPRIDPRYVPPLLVIDGWPPLLQELRSLSNAIRDMAERLARQLGDGDLSLERPFIGDATVQLKTEKTSGQSRPQLDEPQDEAERLRKLSALNGLYSCLDGIADPGGRPPAALYAELCSLAAQLEVLNSARLPVELPAYDHEDLGRCFRAVISVILNIKAAMPIRQGTAFLEMATGDRAGQIIDLKPDDIVIGRLPPQRTAFLRRANGDRVGQSIELKQDRVVIGRSPEQCHIVLDPNGVSRRHAEIYRNGEEYYLADLNSRNSTRVNGSKVIPGIDHRLSPGDWINICGVEFFFYPELKYCGSTDRAELNRELSSNLKIDTIAPNILDSLVELFPQTERLFLALVDPASKQLVTKAFKYRPAGRSNFSAVVPADEIPMSLSRSIVNHVLEQKKAVLSQDVGDDKNLTESASIADLKIRWVMCVPLLTPGSDAFGIIQLDTVDRKQFHQEDLELLAAVACQASIAIQNSWLHAVHIRSDEAEHELNDSMAEAFAPGGTIPYMTSEVLDGKVTPALDVATPQSIRRHTDVSFPARVRVGKTYSLRVQVIPAEETLPTGEIKEIPKPHPHDATMSLDVPKPAQPEEPPPAIRVTIHLAAENFEIDGPTSAEIVVPLLGKSPATNFRLRGEKVGPGRIMIDFAQTGRPVGSVDLSPEVVAVDHEEAPQLAACQGEVSLGSGPGLDIPDLVIKVFEHRHAGQAGRLHFVISSTDLRLKDLPVLDGDLGMQDLNTDVANWVENQLCSLGALAGQPGVAVEDVSATLARVGCNLFEQLLPKTLQDMCWTFRQRGIRKVLILSDEPHIPWELIKPYRTDPVTGELIAEDVFWGEAFALTRWLRGRPPVQRFSFNRILAMAQGGPGPPQRAQEMCRDMVSLASKTACDLKSPQQLAHFDLESADEELAILRLLEASGSQVRVLPARRRELMDAFEKGGFDLLHLMSHGAFGGIFAADASAVLMEDGEFHVAELSGRIVGAMRGASPLIFFNTCHSGRVGFSLTRLGSWGARLVELGCGGFVGTLWPVTDQAAFVFAQAFYDLMSQGLPISEVMLTARHRVRVCFPNDPTWLAYCCFADPWARIQKTVAPC